MQDRPSTSIDGRRERLARAAEALIAERGPAVTMADVARAAGLGMSSVYNTFASKDELLELLELRRSARWDETRRRVRGRHDPRVALAEALWALAETPGAPAAGAGAGDGRDQDPSGSAVLAGLRGDARPDDVLRGSDIVRALPRTVDERARRRVLAIYVDGLFADDTGALPPAEG